MSETPETDMLVDSINSDEDIIRHEYDFVEMTWLAKRLERERDEALHEIKGWKNKWDCAVEMGARALFERDILLEAAKAVVARWDMPVWKDTEPTAVVIYKLRDAVNAVTNKK